MSIMRAIALVAALILAGPSGGLAAEGQPRYLLFQVFTGGSDPETGVYRSDKTAQDYREIVERIAQRVAPERSNPDRILGFSVGPITMDQGEAEVRTLIRDSFDIALATDMAVGFHLDDLMFWHQARDRQGRLLISDPQTLEWTDWRGTRAEGRGSGWMRDARLAPQMCYESPAVKDFVTYWARDVIGGEIRRQIDRLAQAGKTHLFAGVITGWESNLAHGYCSLSHLGYGPERPPADFEGARQRVLHRHIARWAKAVHDAGIDRDRIYTHIAFMGREDHERMQAARDREKIRYILKTGIFRALWTAFNDYSNPGFSAYPREGLFDDIYAALDVFGGRPWAMAEGTNLVLTDGGRGKDSFMDWETYLGRSFNHGATLVNIFGGFLGPGAREFGSATESDEAIAAYRKFLRGDQLVERVPGAVGTATVRSGERASAGPAGPGAGSDAPSGLDERLQALSTRVDAYLKNGGDASALHPHMQTLQAHLQNNDMAKATATLDQIDQVLQ